MEEALFALVEAAVADLEKVSRELEPRLLEGAGAAELVEVVSRGERICASMKARLAHRVEETRVWKGDAYRSGADWLAATTGETIADARRALETAQALEELPATSEAFAAGELSATQAAEIAGAAKDAPGAEGQLLDAAASSSVKGLRDRCREVRAASQPDDAAWARRLHETRRAGEWTDPEGAYNINARLAPDVGARFSAAWNAHTDRIFREARKAGRREPRAAYLADGLVALAAEGPLKPPEVRVCVDQTALRRGYVTGGERCEISGAGPIPVTMARALLDDAAITVLVKDGDDITAVSSSTRTITAGLRRALEARYPVCGVKGCDAERGLQIDHVLDWAKGGETSIENCWRICPHHHFLKTYCGWVVTGGPGGWDLVPPPDGKDPP